MGEVGQLDGAPDDVQQGEVGQVRARGQQLPHAAHGLDDVQRHHAQRFEVLQVRQTQQRAPAARLAVSNRKRVGNVIS